METDTIEPSSDLWDLVLDMDWTGVIHHANSQPQDAKFLDGHWHETPLFLASSLNPPMEVIQAILIAHPESVWINSRENLDLPIHIACRYKADSATLEELLKDFPRTAIERTRWGTTPLMALSMGDNSSDALILDEDYRNKLLVILRAVSRFPQMDTENNNIYIHDKHKHKQKQPKALSNDTIIYDNKEEDTLYVHAAVSLGQKNCPMKVLSFVMNTYPTHVFQRNKYGYLPLHISIQRVLWSKNKTRRFQLNEQTFISCLLKAHPEAAREKIYSDHDRYPLHSALANGHTWSRGVRDLFLAAPEILLFQDPLTRLFPFQLPAVSVLGGNDDDVDLETVYQLLRSRPDVVNYLQIRRKRKKKTKVSNFITVPMKRMIKRMFVTTYTERLYSSISNRSIRFFFDATWTWRKFYKGKGSIRANWDEENRVKPS